MREEVRASLEKNATELVAAQKRVAPVKTGNLRDAIAWRPGRARKSLLGAGARDEFTVTIYIKRQAQHYAHLVEFGAAPHANEGIFRGTQNPGASPQPFFYPTYRSRKRLIKGRVRRALKKSVQRSQGS